MNPGGTVSGPPHIKGGVHFILPETGQHLVAEGKEVVIPNELLRDEKIYSLRGTNKNVLGQILSKAGIKLSDKVENIHYGDIIICVRSAEDERKRIFTGTISEILNEINQSNGCAPVIARAKSEAISQKKLGSRIPLRQKIKDWQTENPNSPRWQKKKERIQQLSNNIQRLRMNASKDLSSDDEKTFLTALVVAVMDRTAERVGNDDSADNGHFGVTGFKKEHIYIVGNKVHLDYVGKSGTAHEKSFSDERIAKALKQAMKNSPSKFIFETSEGFRIKSDKVNRYLQQYNITAKDLRGYLANKWIIEKLKKDTSLRAERSNLTEEKAKKSRKKIFNEALRKTAGEVGHGRGTLKKHYMIPELPDEFIERGNIIDMKNMGYYHDGGMVRPGSPQVAGNKIKTNFVKNNAMKKFRIIYTFNHSKMGFQNSMTIDALNEEQAIEKVKKEVSEVYGSAMLKRFSFKNDESFLAEGGQIPNEILRQLGGNKFLAMMGAAAYYDKDALVIKIRGSRKVKSINIKLTPKDLYDITFINWKKSDFSDLEKKTVNDVYAENLIPVIEKETGLIAKLEDGGPAGNEEPANIEEEIILEPLSNAQPTTDNEPCGCFHTYLIEQCHELCERLANENINEVPELRKEVDEAHNEFQTQN